MKRYLLFPTHIFLRSRSLTSVGRRSSRRPAIVAISCGFGLFLILFRFAILGIFAVQGGFRSDPDAYRALAENLCDYETFGNGDLPTAYRPPLYSILLTPAILAQRVIGSPWAFDVMVVVFHGLCAAVTIAGTWRLTEILCTAISTNDNGTNNGTNSGTVPSPPEIATTICRQYERRPASVSVLLRFFTWKGDHNDKKIASPDIRPNPVWTRWSHWLPPIAATLVAMDPILLQQSRVLMTETLATTFAILLLLAGNPTTSENSLTSEPRRYSRYSRPILTGLLYGLASICRPAFLPVAGLAAMFFLWTIYIPFPRKNVRKIDFLWNGYKNRSAQTAWILFVVAVSFPILIWGVRNQRVFHRLIFTTTHGGYTLLLGNQPDFYAWIRGDQKTPWDAIELQRKLAKEYPFTGGIPLGFPDTLGFRTAEFESDPPKSLDSATPSSTQPTVRIVPIVEEPEMDVQLRTQAIHAIQNDPTGFVCASAYRIRRFFGVLPYGSSPESSLRRTLRFGIAGYGILCAVLCCIGVLCGIRTYWRRETTDRWWLCAVMFLTTVAIHTIYWTDMRMRAVVIPILAIVTAIGAIRTLEASISIFDILRYKKTNSP